MDEKLELWADSKPDLPLRNDLPQSQSTREKITDPEIEAVTAEGKSQLNAWYDESEREWWLRISDPTSTESLALEAEYQRHKEQTDYLHMGYSQW